MYPPIFPDDRAPAKYFHGRDDIRGFFAARLNHYEHLRGGSIILITGAPGAGKSALLTALSDDASKMGWCVTPDLAPAQLASPARMAKVLGVEYKSLHTRSAQVDGKVYKHTWQSERENAPMVTDIIRDAARPQPLLLVLDEAQRLHTLSEIPEDKKSAEATLEAIHNGKIGHPVVFLAAGLDTSRNAFGALSVSRITDLNRVRLGPLEIESAKDVIIAYVYGEFGCDVPDDWIEPLAQQSQGWPQHLVGYANAAGNILAPLHRPPSASDLKEVLAEGCSAQERYYNACAHDITYGQREAIASVFAKIPIGGTVRKREVVNALCQEYSTELADEKFTQALYQGILNECEDGLYGIPIPSLHSWLVQKYAKGKWRVGSGLER
ncbi:MAG: AAA family ATPase [Bacteroidetes bacterium]|nr:AAA family ATPase [Bacteroidota bacterium]